MVAGEIGEHSSGEMQSGDTVLMGGVRAHLHRGIAATRLYHAMKQGVDGERIGSRLIGRYSLILYIVAHC